jgi:hypothetical protein
MKGMKRRKWWFIALSVALLAACVGLWTWSERPPYRFLEGTDLVSLDVLDFHIEPGPVQHVCFSTYRSDVSLDPLRLRISAEFGSSGYIFDGARTYDIGTGAWLSIEDGRRFPPVHGARSVITIVRPATFLDRIRACFSRVDSEGRRL